MQQERNPTTVSQLLTYIQDLQNKVNSLADAREFYDPETASSPGASHVPSQPLNIPSVRGMLGCGSGLPLDTRNMATSGNVFPLKEASRKHSICVHCPKDRNCEVCKRTKITRAPCRKRTGEAVRSGSLQRDVRIWVSTVLILISLKTEIARSAKD